jgi:hypothetical protein
MTLTLKSRCKLKKISLEKKSGKINFDPVSEFKINFSRKSSRQILDNTPDIEIQIFKIAIPQI